MLQPAKITVSSSFKKMPIFSSAQSIYSTNTKVLMYSKHTSTRTHAHTQNKLLLKHIDPPQNQTVSTFSIDYIIKPKTQIFRNNRYKTETV
jgi:PPE-repeat protein